MTLQKYSENGIKTLKVCDKLMTEFSWTFTAAKQKE